MYAIFNLLTLFVVILIERETTNLCGQPEVTILFSTPAVWIALDNILFYVYLLSVYGYPYLYMAYQLGLHLCENYLKLRILGPYFYPAL